MSRPPSSFPSLAPTPAPSSPPPPSESFLSDLDGTAPSLLETSADYSWEPSKVDSGALNLVSWKLDVNARAGDGVEKRGFNAISTVLNHPTKKANPLRSSRKPLPPLVQAPVTLPRLAPASHYEPYLQTITPLYDTFVAAQSVRPGALAAPDEAKSKANLPPLESVPDLFFDPSFDIANPSTWSALVGSGDSNTEDQLSSHLDTLERHLIHEITLRSSSFFSALSNLQDLHSESSTCLTRIVDLQASLKDVGSKQAQKGLEIIDAQERLRILRVTERNERIVAELDDLVKFTKGMVEAGDWAGGLSCLSDVVQWWDRHRDDDEDLQLPLATLPALSALPDSVAHLASSIAGQLQAALSSLLASALTKSDDAEYDGELFRHSAQPMVVGLLRCGKAEGIEEIWREVMTTTIREGSRKHLPVNHAEEDGDEEGRPPEARGDIPILALRQGDAVLRSIEPPPDLGDVIASACELANNRASKILGVRAEQHAQLPLAQFVELFKENWDFVIATETLAKRMIVHLRGTTASQARAFLVQYHSARLTRSANLVQEEQWTQVDVSPATQHVVDLIIEAAVADPAECSVPASAKDEPNSANGVAKVISVEDKSFFVVKATADSLVLLGDYLKIVINLELVVTDVMSRIIEFLKSFNSRTCQVVLGAGAMRSAGLKNITAKHLALASQSLSVIVALIPYIREFIRRHLNPKQAVMLTEFDKLRRDYQEHQNEIHAKLVAIMSDRLAVHVGSLRQLDWEATPDKEGARQYAEMLVKETATLHKVLSKYLAPATVESVLSEVLAAIVHRLSEEYAKIELKSDEGKKRMTQDVALISSRLAPLSESGGSVASLETLVREKPTPRRAISLAMRGMLNRVNSGSAPTTPTKEGLKADEELGTRRKSGEEDDELIVEEPENAEALPQRTHPVEAVSADPSSGGIEVGPANDDRAREETATDRELSLDTTSQADVPHPSDGQESAPTSLAADPAVSATESTEEKEVPLPPVPEKDQTQDDLMQKEVEKEPTLPAKD